MLGEYLDGYSLHHQLLSASYNVGGPSAGFALAINTLSALLNLPVQNDFGITGAPWIKGAKRGEIGASVIIGGHRKKTEKVLQYLQRMYLPVQNYQDMEPEVLDAYRAIGKDVVAINSFSALVPEVFYFGDAYQQSLHAFFKQRQDIALAPASLEILPAIRQENSALGIDLRCKAEQQIRQRLKAIEQHMQKQGEHYASLDRIFLNSDSAPRQQTESA